MWDCIDYINTLLLLKNQSIFTYELIFLKGHYPHVRGGESYDKIFP